MAKKKVVKKVKVEPVYEDYGDYIKAKKEAKK